MEDLKCHKCGTGYLRLRFSDKFNKYFYGCSNWPKCHSAIGAYQDYPYLPFKLKQKENR